MSAKIGILIVVVIWWIAVYSSLESSIHNDIYGLSKKYEPIFTGNLLSVCLFVGFIFDVFIDGFKNALIIFLNNCVNLVVIISIYYFFVFLFLKYIRKHLHPITVSTIWMLPNLLYFFVLYRNGNFVTMNAYILDIPYIIMYLIIGVWFLGFACILGYKIIEHFNYRNSILEDAKEVTDQRILDIFEKQKENLKHDRKIQIMISKHLKTPLTIGIRNKVLVLPNMNYSEEELNLILKHEIIHIGRSDVLTKLHLIFCNALCWFNPLMWLANKKCSEDLELSCDASVLANEEDVLRKQYARLILKNANSEKGFTTCLSANAESLKYRLENIMQPKKKKIGGFIILLFVFILNFSWGNINVAINGYNGSSELFNSKDVELVEIIPMNVESKNQVYSLENQDKIIEYFSNLELSKLPRTSILKNESDKCVWFNFEDGSDYIRVVVYDHYIQVDRDLRPAYDQYYYVEEGIDWEYLESFISEYPALRLLMSIEEEDFGGSYLWPALQQVTKDGEVVYQKESYQFFSNYYQFKPTEFKVDFYDEVLSDIEVIEETKDGIKTYVIDKDNITSVPMTNIDVRYTIKATVIRNEQVYDVEFMFEEDYWEEETKEAVTVKK